jgi:hypothetical protein
MPQAVARDIPELFERPMSPHAGYKMQENQEDKSFLRFLAKGSESKNCLSDAIFSTQSVKNMASLDNFIPGRFLASSPSL